MLGWQNSATYGSVISYNLYWVVVIVYFVVMRVLETRKNRSGSFDNKGESGSSSDEEAANASEKTNGARTKVVEG